MTIHEIKGLICLDIDGTLAADRKPIPLPVTSYLKEVSEQGWQVMFVTGRTLAFTLPVLKDMDFSYLLSVQNGATIVSLPTKEVIFKHYLDASILAPLNEIFKGASCDFLIEGGVEKRDCCYYRKERFSPQQLEYLRFREQLAREPWKAVVNFDPGELSSFALVKCFGPKEILDPLASKIYNQLHLHISVIHDPFYENGYIIIATHPLVSKGSVIKEQRKRNLFPLIIAAGDDYNDESMLDAADIKIVMETAPIALQKKATLVAPSASQMGIIAALKQVTKV